MKQKFIVCVLVLCCMVLIVGNSNQAEVYAGSGNCNGGGNKITICHYPPRHPGNDQTISINQHPWSVHHTHHRDYI